MHEQPTKTKNTLKYARFALLCWSVAVGLSLGLNLIQHQAHIEDIGRTLARASFDKDVLYRRWNALSGGVYATQSEIFSPNPYLEVPERELTTPAGKKLTLVNPAYMTRQIHELGQKESGIQGHITSLFPLRPLNAPDDWEIAALQRFEKGATEVSSVELFRGAKYVRWMRPLFVEKSCLKCHAKQGYQEGQVRGGISQSVPLEPLEQQMSGALWSVWGGHLGLWLLGNLIIYLAYRKLSAASSDLERQQHELLRAHKELQMFQSQLLQSEKMAAIGQLAAGVAHEINNPLAFIKSNLNALNKYTGKLSTFIQKQSELVETYTDERTRQLGAELKQSSKSHIIIEDIGELIQESLDGANRVQSIVENLKIMSRPGEDEKIEIDINEYLDATLPLIQDSQTGLNIVKNYQTVSPFCCHPRQLCQVLINLITNARQAMGEEGQLTLSTWSASERIFVSVADDGCGIAPENLKRIFDPFFTTREVGQGVGLGLSAAYDIVNMNAGNIHVASEPGKGTTFTLSFPQSGEKG